MCEWSPNQKGNGVPILDLEKRVKPVISIVSTVSDETYATRSQLDDIHSVEENYGVIGVIIGKYL